MTSTLPDGKQSLTASQATVSPNSSTANGNSSVQAPDDILSDTLAAVILDRKKREWASWVNVQYVKCKNARVPFERQWFINLAFNNGRQYMSPVSVPGHGFRLSSPKAPPWRVRLVINKIRTAIRVETAKLTSSRPIPTVIPATNEDEDFSAAQVGEQLLKSAFAFADFEKAYRSFVWWGSVCGTSFLKSYWDAGAPDYDCMTLPPVPMVANPQTGEPMPVPQAVIDQIPALKKMLETPVPAKGKICVERVTPFHIYVPDLLAEGLEDQPYVMQVMTRDPLWVQKAFPDFGPVTPDTRAATTLMDSSAIIAKGSEEHLDSVLVKEMWLKPNAHPDFPSGGMITVINDRVAQVATEWPLPFPDYPFYKYNGLPTGGFYSDSIIVDLIPVQKEYNRTRSQMVEIKNTMGKPRLVYQKGSINPKMLSSEPGQSVPYTAGYEKPQIMPGVEVPQSFTNELQILSNDFDDISGQHEISRGDTPNSQLTSGTAISFLQEQDDAKLGYQVASIELAIQMLGKHYLKYVSQNWDADRIVHVTGKNNTYETMHWKQGDLRGNTDVRVQTGSALPFSKAARQALLTEMMQNGFIPPEVGLEMMDLGGFDKMVEDFLVDKRQAMRENMKMVDAPQDLIALAMQPPDGPNGEKPQQVMDPRDSTGTKPLWLTYDGQPFQPQPPIPVNTWDNHEAHIHWHNQFRKTQEFELLPQPNKDAFELHVQLHQMALMANMVNPQGMVTTPGAAPVGPPDPNADPNQQGGTNAAEQDGPANKAQDQQTEQANPEGG